MIPKNNNVYRGVSASLTVDEHRNRMTLKTCRARPAFRLAKRFTMNGTASPDAGDQGSEYYSTLTTQLGYMNLELHPKVLSSLNK